MSRQRATNGIRSAQGFFQAPNRKFTPDQIRAIRSRASIASCETLAREYEIGYSVMYRILNGMTYIEAECQVGWRPPLRPTHPERERVAQPIPASSVAAILAYRAEKAKRANRIRPEMEAAHRVWTAQMEAEQAARKGGRPPKAFLVGKQRPKELADLLPKFNGASYER